jgi:amino acid permease
MNKKEKQQQQLDYPVRTVHEFFSEISNEWGHFKRGAIMSLIVCSILLVGFVFAFLHTTKIHSFEFSGLFLVLPIVGFLIYTIYLMISQYRFFRRWEKRMEHIYSYEEKLLADDDKNNRETDKQSTLSHT